MIDTFYPQSGPILYIFLCKKKKKKCYLNQTIIQNKNISIKNISMHLELNMVKNGLCQRNVYFDQNFNLMLSTEY